jgi:uncharacterized protein YkwD
MYHVRMSTARRSHRYSSHWAACLSGAAVFAAAAAAAADPVAVVNSLRREGCANQPAAVTTLRPDKTLNDVARELARAKELPAAIEHVGYPAAASASYHVKGARADADIRRMLTEQYCPSVNDKRFAEVGVHQSGDETWIVLAVRTPSKPVLEPAAVASRVLELVNAARVAGRDCGRERFSAAPQLTLSTTLSEAASGHARDMARTNTLAHTGSDGSNSGDRITRSGYVWGASGENVAAGQKDADSVVAAWLASPGHCATLMGPYFKEMGVAFALAPDANPSIYWAQLFAAPQ